MTEEKRIHIMSAGQSVHKTFPIAYKTISYATKVYVIVEKDVYEKSSDDETKSRRQAIIDSIDELKRIATYPLVEEGVEVIKIPDETFDDIRDEVFNIYQKDKDAKYYLNISGGGKMLSLGLFMMGLWIEAVPFHINRDGYARIISIPKAHMRDFRKNPNRIKVLEILNDETEKCLSKKDLKKKLDKHYTLIQTNSEKNPNETEKYSKTKKAISYGGFYSLIQKLIDWGLVEQRPHKGSNKEIEYCITPDGQFTLQFIKL